MTTPAQQLEAFLSRVPYIRFLGMQAELAGDEMTAILPPSEHLIGNTFIPALHGGVIGAFLEMTALAQLSVASSRRGGCPRPSTSPSSICGPAAAG